MSSSCSEARVDGLGFEGEDREDGFVDAAQRMALDETLQRLHPERSKAAVHYLRATGVNDKPLRGSLRSSLTPELVLPCNNLLSYRVKIPV